MRPGYEIKRGIRSIEREYNCWKTCPPKLDTSEARAVYFVFVVTRLIESGLAKFELDTLVREIAVHITKCICKGDDTRSYGRWETRRTVIDELVPHAPELLRSAECIVAERTADSKFVHEVIGQVRTNDFQLNQPSKSIKVSIQESH